MTPRPARRRASRAAGPSSAASPGPVLAWALALLVGVVAPGPAAGAAPGTTVPPGPAVPGLAPGRPIPPRPAPAQEDREEILAYDVRIEVRDGGVLRVTEAIEVRALGREIRRGIYWDFPTRFPREEGFGTVVAPFRVLSVRRDDRPEPHSLEPVRGPAGRGGIRVRIGDPDVSISHGVHRYTLVYETARWIRFGEETDRLSWNVTGNGWSFPIRRATAEVALPGRVPAGGVELAAWTGPEGSTSRDARWSWAPEESVARFRTTEPLEPGEGLTVEVTYPAGVVAPPSARQEARWFRLDWGGWVEAAAAVTAVLGLYLVLWIRVGRDPASGTIVVRYEPPEGFSPAGLGFLRERGFDPAQLTAALVSLAVKGALTIERRDDAWVIRSSGEVPDNIARGERRLHEGVVGSRGALTLNGSTSEPLRKGVRALRKALEGQIEKTHFVTNRRWFLAGAAVSAAAFAVLAWRTRFQVAPAAWAFGLWLTFWTMGVGSLLVRAGRSWLQALSGEPVQGIAAAVATLFAVPFVAAEIFVARQFLQLAPLHMVAGAVAIGVVNVLFYHLLERPTLKGRGVLDRLEGFRRFLGATEEDRMDRLQPPDRSLELFERFLPHAIALKVENEWAQRFEDAIARGASASGGGHASPGWYVPGGHGGGPGAMTSALGGSLSSSLSASSAAPSGGSGGSGSSGGGGGGGGGGGW